MIVAVFGDVHGNLPGMYELAKGWQQENKQQIDLMLQTGDIGLWTSCDQMDRPTKKYYAKNKSEPAGQAYITF